MPRGEDRPAAAPSPVIGDGRRSLPDGEPLLHRWFALAMLVIVPVGIAVIVAALFSINRAPLPPAERRPPGTAQVTHDRGQAALTGVEEYADGPGCSADIQVIGAEGSHATGLRALSTVCQLLESADFAPAAAGMRVWSQADGLLRFGVFERSGVESSARLEDGRLVIELGAKFEFEDAIRAAASLIHELTHLGQGHPGTPVSAEDELIAIRLQDATCQRLRFARDDEPRSCLDARELLADPDPLAALVAAGYLRAG